MSSETAFTNSDYDDAEQQRVEFGDQASLASPKSPPQPKTKVFEPPKQSSNETIQEQADSFLESEIQTMKTKSIGPPTPPNQTLEKTLTLNLKQRASSMVADIKERFQRQITRLKSLFRKPQPEDFQIVDLEKGPDFPDDEGSPKLKTSKSEVLIPKL